MNVVRRDLGADIVCLPDRELVVIHPDLTYGKAVGELMATCPGMSMSEANELVSRVSRAPRSIEREVRRRMAQGCMVVASMFVLVGAPAVAHAGVSSDPSGVLPTSCTHLP